MGSKGGDFLLDTVGGPHVLGDKMVEGFLVAVLDKLDGLLVGGRALGNRLGHDSGSNLSRDLANAGKDRVEKTLGTLLGGQGIGTGTSSRVDQTVADGGRLGQDTAQAETREDVHVVALARCTDNTGGGISVLGESSARSENDLALGVDHGLLKRALGLVSRVGEGEDNGALVQSGHGAENIL